MGAESEGAGVLGSLLSSSFLLSLSPVMSLTCYLQPLLIASLAGKLALLSGSFVVTKPAVPLSLAAR